MKTKKAREVVSTILFVIGVSLIAHSIYTWGKLEGRAEGRLEIVEMWERSLP